MNTLNEIVKTYSSALAIINEVLRDHQEMITALNNRITLLEERNLQIKLEKDISEQKKS
jgi:hypothetical protein